MNRRSNHMPLSPLESLVRAVFAKVRNGRLTFIKPNGDREEFGDPTLGASAELRVLNPRFYRRVALGGDIGFGEAYMHGDFETDNLTALLTIFIQNPQLTRDEAVSTSFLARGFNRMLHWMRRNTVANSRDNIMAHYDLGNEFYSLFLDPSMTYSCAIFDDGKPCLTSGQHRKLDAIAEIADVQPGDRVVEIGCGWGSFASRTASVRGAHVDGITISPSQLEYAQRRVRDDGVGDKVNLKICDYRHAEGTYDRLGSIEMIEAVGAEYLNSFFAKCSDLLKSGGRMGLQVITIPHARYDSYRRSVDWIQKHIFPGGFLPSEQAMAESVASSSKLRIDRIDQIGDHYGQTLRGWREKFHGNWDRIKTLGFDDVFRRTWEYYLAYCEAGFTTRYIGVAQIGLVKS
jgi:cyclopropane-fatty-acyl-phospholipid synthase